MFVPLHTLGIAKLGYKSLQNAFYYVDRATIEQYEIETWFLVPILMLKSLNGRKYLQKRKNETWLFCCRRNLVDLRGTGARRYIQSMAKRGATQRKQSGRNQTIREALEAQGGTLWYAPRARPTKHHIWLRKAIDGVFAPYIFSKAALVDQRCNSITPNENIEWEELATVLTSTIFSYCVEINGAASMGAGALEASTRKLLEYPVFDIRTLSCRSRRKLVALGNAVWKNSVPVDWTNSDDEPGEELKRLDSWLLKKCGARVSHDELYRDFRAVCTARISVAKDKGKKIRKQQEDSIGSVADSIVNAVGPKVESRNFPEDFATSVELDLRYDFGNEVLEHISMEQFFDTMRVVVTSQSGKRVYDEQLDLAVADALVRALLWGRTKFRVSSNGKKMMVAVKKFIAWFSAIDGEIEQYISESAFGTGYEMRLREEVYSRLGVRQLASTEELPVEISL